MLKIDKKIIKQLDFQVSRKKPVVTFSDRNQTLMNEGVESRRASAKYYSF